MHTSPPDARAPRADAHRAPTLTAAERSFLQGVLAHAPGLCALTLPTAASYARVADGVWAGGTHASWGTDQREAPVRLCGAAGRHHLEVRCVDGTAAPHLVLAGLLGAGAAAVRRGDLLASGDCATPVARMSVEERRALGVEGAGRLPRTIEQARRNLEQDEELRAVFGDDFVEKYVAVNEVRRVRRAVLCGEADSDLLQTLEKLLVGEDEEATVAKLVNYY